MDQNNSVKTVEGDVNLSNETSEEAAVNVEQVEDLSNETPEEEGSNDLQSNSSHHSNEVWSPGGSSLWYPNVPENEKPVLKAQYQTLDECKRMYAEYAEKSGFDMRLSTQKNLPDGRVKLKYILCSRADLPDDIEFDTLDEASSSKKRKNVSSQKTNCKARIKFRIRKEENIYEVYEFKEAHNHELVPEHYRHLLRKRRQLQHEEEGFIHQVAATNIGATKAHNLFSNIRGSRENVHGTVTNFKNFRRDNCFIGENDATMLIDKMEARKVHLSNFSFDYKLKNSEMHSFFWADEVAKLNYKEFGDIISFDATYRTNKYGMVFVPFTGVDNHRKCVTFGAGMLGSEDTEAYKWLLSSFLVAFEKQPNIVVTDQDHAIKKAIEGFLRNQSIDFVCGI